MKTVGVIGSGAWGTALAQALHSSSLRVTMWTRDQDLAHTISHTHSNPIYLAGAPLNPEIQATSTLSEALAADIVFLVVPTQYLRDVCRAAAPLWKMRTPAILCSKGIEIATGHLASTVVEQELPPQTPLAVLSGPSFARDVIRGLPCAVTLACADTYLGQSLTQAIGNRTLRPYHTSDVIGTEIGGAIKNVLAIACGILDGKALGESARAALLTRGLAEMTRLGVALGGRPETFMGLSGIGDLILTATSMQSRNFSLGVALGQGHSFDEVMAQRKAVTEGVATAAAIAKLAKKQTVEMPICAAVYRILHENENIDRMIDAFLARPLRSEVDHCPASLPLPHATDEIQGP